MKKVIAGLALAVVLSMVLSISTIAAAPTQAGFYLVGKSAGITIKGARADKSEIEPVFAKPTNSSVCDADSYREFYPGAVQLKVTINNTDSSLQYLAILSVGNEITEKSLKYIDQQGNGDSLTFYVYPDSITSNTRLTLWITNSDGDVVKIPLGYWKETSYEERTYVVGDVNEDSSISSYDAACILQHCTYGHIAAAGGDVELTNYQIMAADVNEDTTVSPLDASLILQYIVRSQTYTNYSLADFVAAVTH